MDQGSVRAEERLNQGNPWIPDPWSQQFTPWQPGGEAAQPETVPIQERRGLLVRWSIAFVLTGAVTTLALLPRPSSYHPSELDYVPRDAFALVCARPAQLENHAALNEICNALGITLENWLPRGVNFSTADIERISLVALQPPGSLVLTESVPYWLMVSTTTAYNPKAVLQALGGGRERSWLQKSYVLLDQPAGMAVHFAQDRLIVFGPEKAVQDFLERKPGKRKGLFSEAVAYARDSRYPLVACVNFMPALTQWFGQQTAEVMPFFQLDAATLALEGGEQLHAKVRLEFVNEKVARMAGTQLRNGTRIGRQALTRWQADAENALDSVFYRIAEAKLADLHVEQDGRDIRLTLSSLPEQNLTALGESLLARFAGPSVSLVENTLLDDLNKIVDFAVAGFGVGKGRQLALAMEGKPAPDFFIKDLHGRGFHLKDAIGKRPIVIEFGSFT